VAERPEEPWWISPNVTRTRVTLLGFNLTVIAFLSALMLEARGDEAFTHHLPGMASLFLSFSLSFLSAICLLASQELDHKGNSRPLLFSLGDILMYVALSQSLAAMMRSSLRAIDKTVEHVAMNFGGNNSGSVVLALLATVGVAAWMLTIYVGPVISIRRSPTSGRTQLVVISAYALVLLLTFAIATDAHMVQDVVLNDPEPTWKIFLCQFMQPLTW
jgi:hypothetical protein